MIDIIDEDKALCLDNWEVGIAVRPWRFPRKVRFNDRNLDGW